MLDPFFRAAAHRELDDLVAPSAIIGIDGAIVLSPSHTIELAAGEMSGHAAHIARMNTHKATAGLVEASFPCDSGHWVYLTAIDGGWVLAVQTAHMDRTARRWIRGTTQSSSATTAATQPERR
jgi:hypothetical protein